MFESPSSESVKIFITAGDPSADAHAARLMQALRTRIPHVVFQGFGGPAMEMQGLQSVARLEDLAVTGFAEVARRYGYFRTLLERCGRLLNEQRPALFIPVDYPGFNIRLAAHARKANVPVAWYIAPQLWAWGKSRAKRLAEVVDRMLVVFPFEQKFFSDFGIRTELVGHPLLDDPVFDTIGEHGPVQKTNATNDANLNSQTVVLMPGSRTQEVRRHVRLLADLVRGINSTMTGISIEVPKPARLDTSLYAPLVGEGAALVEDSRLALRNGAAGMIKAGTSTLEAALLGLPFATFYKTSMPSYLLAKKLVNVSSVTMMNLLLDRNVVHEYIQHDATPARLLGEVHELLANTERRTELFTASQEVRSLLGGPGATNRAADVVASMLERRGY